MKSSIIVIDKDETVRDSIEWLVRLSGHGVIGYDSAKTYLNIGAKYGRPDCVIMDIHMPEIDGLVCYQMLKGQYPDVPVIFISDSPDRPLAQQARALEPKRFFIKPLDTEAILACIENTVTASGKQWSADEENAT